MSSIKRKLRRAQANQSKKNQEKELASKVALFGKLPDKCLTCEKSFNKMDKEQVMSWNVVIRKDEEKVNLYCPQCWESAMNIVKDYTEKRRKENAVLSTK